MFYLFVILILDASSISNKVLSFKVVQLINKIKIKIEKYLKDPSHAARCLQKERMGGTFRELS